MTAVKDEEQVGEEIDPPGNFGYLEMEDWGWDGQQSQVAGGQCPGGHLFDHSKEWGQFTKEQQQELLEDWRKRATGELKWLSRAGFQSLVTLLTEEDSRYYPLIELIEELKQISVVEFQLHLYGQEIGWQDHEAPPLAHLINLARRIGDSLPRPVYIHCSAGIGRTACLLVFIAFFTHWFSSLMVSSPRSSLDDILTLVLQIIASTPASRRPEPCQRVKIKEYIQDSE